MRTNSRDRLRGLTPSQRGLVGCKLRLLLLCVHVEPRLQCGKIREHIDAGLGSFMTYVQVGRPEPPWHTEQLDPLHFLRFQLRMIATAPDKSWSGTSTAQFTADQCEPSVTQT